MIVGVLGMVHRSLQVWLKQTGLKEGFQHATESFFAEDYEYLEICVEHLRSSILTC